MAWIQRQRPKYRLRRHHQIYTVQESTLLPRAHLRPGRSRNRLAYMTQTGNVMRVAGIVQSQSTVAYWPNGNFVPKLTLTRLKVSHVR